MPLRGSSGRACGGFWLDNNHGDAQNNFGAQAGFEGLAQERLLLSFARTMLVRLWVSVFLLLPHWHSTSLLCFSFLIFMALKDTTRNKTLASIQEMTEFSKQQATKWGTLSLLA